jgi:hypothetical protein
MNNFEENLRRALERVEPPSGFAKRVLVRAAQEEKQKQTRTSFWFGLFGMGGFRWAALCAYWWLRVARFMNATRSGGAAKRPRNN